MACQLIKLVVEKSNVGLYYVNWNACITNKVKNELWFVSYWIKEIITDINKVTCKNCLNTKLEPPYNPFDERAKDF